MDFQNYEQKNDQKIPLDIKKTASYLDISEKRLERLIDRRILTTNWGKYTQLLRFDKKVSHIEEGSVLNQQSNELELVRGFPKIRRALLLEPAIIKNFETADSVAIEEKMNGYNVRAAKINGEVLAFTRGGLVCPYTTEKVRELINLDFFRDHPDLVLCAEMVGPDNPYVPKDIYNIDSLQFFVFDIRRKNTGKPYSIDEKRKLADEYGLAQVKFFGEYPVRDASQKIQKIIEKLGKDKREGVVVKDPEMVLQPMKYTSSQSNCSDLEHAFKFYNDTGRDYLFSRIVREGFQVVEWNENDEELQKRCLQLGQSILIPMVETITKVGRSERITDDVQIRVKNLHTAGKFKNYLQRLGIEAVFEEPVKQGDDQYLVRIKKLHKSTNDKTESIWNGDYW